MIEMISRDTSQPAEDEVKRTDREFLPFRGFTIRRINIVRLPFGTSLDDTSHRSKTTLTNIANKLHHLTRKSVIEKNLFFKARDTINPYLLADNERFLRGLSYISHADFKISLVPNTDSADVTVFVKDVFSLGGDIGSLGLKKTDIEAREDNISGSGNAAILYGLYDANRKNDFAFGGELIKRNIGGSFMDQTLGYQSYYTSLKTPHQENYYYFNLKKPLLNRFMSVTYELDASYHSTSNKYNNDSVYLSDFRYRYYQFEGWLGYNINARGYRYINNPTRLRYLSGVRVITRKFGKIPTLYKTNYNWQFADLTAILASFTIYRQNFFKTQYIYGFGRYEDIPEGMEFSATAGQTIRADQSRPYINLSYDQYGFIKRNNYLHFTLKTEGYFAVKKLEDINMLASIDYFSSLKSLGAKWKQRLFLNFSATGQINPVLNEPLFLNSKYAMPEYGNDPRGGDLRITAKGESVFFSPWWLAAFRFAPIVSANLTAFKPYLDKTQLYSSIGAGIRARNESLIFGTIEIKGVYFPGGNYYHESFGIDLSTNIIFKYNTQFLKKPDFIQIN